MASSQYLYRRRTPALDVRVGSVARLAAALTMAALTPVASAQATLGLTPMAVCPEVVAAPEIDGDVGDDAWRMAAYLGPFVEVATNRHPSQKTKCVVCRAGDRLFLAFTCDEDSVDRLTTDANERDHPRAWSDDCVQIFWALGEPRDEYNHVVVTASGAIYDERVAEAGQVRDLTWDTDVMAAVRLTPQGWVCEVSVPLGAPPASVEGPCAAARVNVARAETPHGEWSSWAALAANFHEYAGFGELRMADAPVVRDLEVPSPQLGRNEFRIAMGASPRPHLAELQVLREETIHAKTAVVVGSGTSASLGYRLEAEGSGAVRVVLREEGTGAVNYATAPVRFSVHPVRRSLGALGNRLSAATGTMRGLSGPAVPALRREALGLKSRLAGLSRRAASMQRTGAAHTHAWDELFSQVAPLGPQVRALEAKVKLLSMGLRKLPSFALGSEGALRKVLPHDSEYSLSSQIDMKCARGERESGQVIVASLGQPVEDVRVSWTGLSGPDGHRIAHGDVHVWRVGYVQTRPPVYPVEHVGRWPDPLLPIEPFSVPPGEVQPVWVTVDVPSGTTPGRYTGTLTFATQKDGAQEARLVVDVWDMELPRPGRFRTGFGTVFRGDVSRWYGFGGQPPVDFRRKLYDVLLANRVSPAGLYVQETWPLQEDWDWCLQRGMGAVSLGNLGTASPQRVRDIAQAAEHLAEAGIPDAGYVLGFGILSPDDVERARDGFSRLRRFVPRVRRVCPSVPTRSLWGYANVWATLTSEYDDVLAQKRRRVGEETWWSVCCGPRHPYANFFIDYPATDARTLFWAAYKYGVTGFLYYEVAMWASNMLAIDVGDPSVVIHEDPAALEDLRAGKRWPDVDWNSYTFSRYNGDGLLIYPGPNEEPLPSLRLEIIRDGIEDYELLALLDARATELKERDTDGRYGFLVDEARAITAVAPQVVRDLTNYTSDPAVIRSERDRVARQVIRLQRVITELTGTGR